MRRIARVLLVLMACSLAPLYAHAQGYTPIPNYGPGGAVQPDQPGQAGYYMRRDINSRFNGAMGISPQIAHIQFSQLPATVTNGQVYYVTDGASGTPCKGGGSGAMAMGVNGVWACPGGVAGSLQYVTSYGATANCTLTPDDIAIQSAINSTNNNGNAGTNPVYIPASQPGNTGGCYLLGKPLVVPHGGITLFGDGREQTFLQSNYYGPVLLAGTDTLNLSSALLSGGGNAINLTGTPFLELSMLLRNHLSGHTALSIEFELNVPGSPSNSVILQSAYDWPYQGYARARLTDVGAFGISYQSSNPHLNASITVTTSGQVSTNSANNSLSVAANHAIGVYWDGSHFWTCVDGTASTPVTATGTLIQNNWESMTLPDMFGNGAINFPDGGYGGNDSFNGKIDNLRISNNARSASGTCPAVPTTKFTYDSNTDLLLTGLSCSDGTQYCLANTTGEYAVYAQSQYAPGTSSYPTSNNVVWFPVLGRGGTFTPHLYIHDLTIGWSAASQGAYILNAPWSQFERIAGMGEHNGLNLYYQDYEDTVRETRFLGSGNNGYQAYQWGYVSNTANVENATAEQAFVCFNLESSQQNWESKSGHCLFSGATAIAWLINGGGATLIDPFTDQESADSNLIGTIYFKSAIGLPALVIENGLLNTYGGVPFIIHDASGLGPILIHGTNFNNFGEDQPAAAAIQFPGYESFSNIIGTVWQGQGTIAAAPLVASAPGTCTGTGGDTNCATFLYPSAVQFSVNTGSSADSTGTGTVLGVTNFYGSHGTFSSGGTFANTYSLLTGQVYLLKGINLLNLYTSGGFEFKIAGTTNTVDLYQSSNAGNISVDAIAPSAGFYNFQLSFGAPTGATHAIITPAQTPANQVPASPDLLQDVTFADANVPLSNEIGNQHVQWTQQVSDGYPTGHIGQVERYIP